MKVRPKIGIELLDPGISESIMPPHISILIQLWTNRDLTSQFRNAFTLLNGPDSNIHQQFALSHHSNSPQLRILQVLLHAAVHRASIFTGAQQETYMQLDTILGS